jgi:glycosyltransferase involved in cell wall biosynthesis
VDIRRRGANSVVFAAEPKNSEQDSSYSAESEQTVMRTNGTVLSVFALKAGRVGGIQLYARELSAQLADIGWKSLLVFSTPPAGAALNLFELPNTQVEVVEDSEKCEFRPIHKMVKLMAKARPRIVHLHFIDPWRPYLWLARWYGAERVFFTDHGSRPTGYVPSAVAVKGRLLRRLACLPLTKVICVSSYVSRCVQKELPLPGHRIKAVYNGIDISRAEVGLTRRDEFRTQHSIPSDRIVVLQTSWLIRQKGVDLLLDAARRVISRNRRVQFVIAGDGPLRREYERTAQRFGIADNVLFTGVVGDPLGEGLYAACDIACQLSRWEEAFGLTVAEAMASKRPVVVTRVGGIPELVQDGESGYVVERDDCDAVVRSILHLARDAKLRESLGKKGYEVCRMRFDLSRNVAAIIHHFGLI